MSFIIIAFALLLLRNDGAGTLPVFIQLRGEPEPLTRPPPSSDSRFMQRSLYNIVWNCFTTIFICTWVSVHPNIPARGEAPMKILWTKIRLMLWTLVMPELIFTWAVKQWLAARMIAKLYRGRGWSETHGHFFIMGGFDLVVPIETSTVSEPTRTSLEFKPLDKPISLDSENSRCITLSLDQFQKLVQESRIIFPNITVSQIRDKSKSDFLSKSIAILQMFWFVVQCIARRMQGLALTQLELVTLALACLNAVTSYFWWYKPLGVREPVLVYYRGTLPKEPEDLSSHNDVSVQPSQGFLSSIGTTLRRIPTQIKSFFMSVFHNCGKVVRQHPLPVIPLLPFYYPFWFLYLSIKKFVKSFGDVALTNEIPVDATQVPTFYAPDTEMTNVAIFLLLPIFAAVFGGLHCIGWNFAYATQVEQTLWRITSALITAIPFATLLILCCNTAFNAKHTTLDYPAWALVVIYLLARSSLLVQAALLLRLQPASAYRAVDWTKFLFHTA